MPFKPLYLIDGMDGGMNTHDYPENLKSNESPNIYGMEFNAKNLKKTKGFTAYGTETETTPGFTLYNHRILSTDEIMIKTVANKIKFYDSISDTWHLLTASTFATGVRFFMASFNGYLYFCDGTNNFSRWKGASWSTLANPVTGASIVIDLATGTGSRFANSGSGLIESDTFTWTGKVGDQLTGVSGISSNHAAGARVIVSADTSTYSTQPKGSVGCFFKNRIFIRDDANRNIWYFSKLADNTTPEDDLTNFTVAGTGTGDAGNYPMPAPIIGVTTMISAANTAIQLLLCADGIAYAFSVSDSGTTTVATATPFKVFSADLVSKGAITVFENDLILVDSFNSVRTLGYQDVNTPANTRRISDNLEPTLDLIDFTSSDVWFYNRKAYIQGIQNGGSINNFTLMKDTNPDAFSVFKHWQLNALCENYNNLYGLSSFDGRVFKLFDGYDAAGAIYSSFYSTPAINFGAPLIMKELRQIRLKGYITNGCTLTCKLYKGQSTTPFTFTISGSNTNITSDIDNAAIGTVVFGTSVFGDSVPAGASMKEFYCEFNVPTFGYFDTIYLTIENVQKDVAYELSKIMFYAEVQNSDVIKPSAIL